MRFGIWQCMAQTTSGQRCRNRGFCMGFCHVHEPIVHRTMLKRYNKLCAKIRGGLITYEEFHDPRLPTGELKRRRPPLPWL